MTLLTALGINTPMCVTCLAKRTSRHPTTVVTALTVLGRAQTVHRKLGACQGCAARDVVYILKPWTTPSRR